MATITIDVQSMAMIKKLDDLEKSSGNIAPAMQVIGRKILTKVQLGFKSSSDPWGASWLPLKHRKGQPLKDTGHLLRSITSQVVESGNTVEVGTNLQSKGVKYPAVHQYGAKIDIPARSQKVYRNLLKSGSLTKFVKKTRANFEQNVTLPAYSITIPARPFLPLRESGVDMPEQWSLDVLNALEAHFSKAVKA